jgi:hypothetical protein
MGIYGLCFEVGQMGRCCDNCYECADKYREYPMTDREAIKNTSREDQERMLRDYKEGRDK